MHAAWGWGIPESCCSLLQGESEGLGTGERWGKGLRIGWKVFGRMWPDPDRRPLAHHRSKTKHTRTQRESAPYGTILNSKQNKDIKKGIQIKTIKKQMFNLASVFLPLCLHKEQNFLFVPIKESSSSCACFHISQQGWVRLPSAKEVTKLCWTTAPHAHLWHCYHGNTGRDDSQPICDSTATCSFVSLLLTSAHCLDDSSLWPRSKLVSDWLGRY